MSATATFLRARDFLLAHREDYDAATAGFTFPDLPELLYLTSGTTAQAKLVLHTHRNIRSPGWAKHAWSSFFAPWNAANAASTTTGSTMDPCASGRRSRARRASARIAGRRA